MNNRGIVAIPSVGRAISGDDTQRVIDAARTVSLKSNREMIHALPRYFIVDGQDRVSDPEGMHGQRLDVEMHIVTASVNAVQNLMKCVERAGVQIDTVIAAPVAAAQAVLEADEQREGVVVVDIGGGTTELAVLLDGAVVHTAVLPVGGANITRDLVVGLRCPFTVAEEAKANHAHAQPEAVLHDEPITLAAFGQAHEQEVHRKLIAEIVQARIEEMLSMVMVEVKRAGHVDAISAGLVLTGGTAELPGITNVAEEVTGLPTRIGQVGEIYGLVESISGPTYATTLGLLRWMTESSEPSGQSVALRMPKAPNVLNLLRGVGRFGRLFLPQ
jgi:cell division protein FtsA